MAGILGIASATAPQPRVFAPGVVSGPANDAAATFSPDGRTVYFFRSNGEGSDIMTSHFDGSRWSQPVIASFSGRWRDLEPTMAPDGSYLIFASSRPIDGGGKPIDGHWGGQVYPGRGGHLWRVNRQGDGWSAPILLPATVNRFDSTFSPAIAADGSLYFMAATGPGGHFQLYCSRFKDGQFRTPELLPFSAGSYGGVDPAVAPDQSFIVFASNRPPTPAHDLYAFIAFRTHGSWGEPIPLGPAVNSLGHIIELRLGPDRHTLYLTSNGNIWWVDLAPWLERGAHAGAAPTDPESVTLGGILDPDSDDTPAFTPDGQTVFFDRSSGSKKAVLISHCIDGRWAPPRIAPFSGRWFDQDPVVSPDGSYMLFDSDRPPPGRDKPLVQTYFGRRAPGANLWRVDRKGAGWGEPVWLSATVNARPFTDFASIAADSSLYFLWWDQGEVHIFRSQYTDGRYLTPERVPLGDPLVTTHDPAIAPDESFIIFDYGRTAGSLGRLSMALREADHWSKPVDFGDRINRDKPWGARLSPDGNAVYVTGATRIWRIALQVRSPPRSACQRTTSSTRRSRPRVS